MDAIPPTLPFHLARAYGTRPPTNAGHFRVQPPNQPPNQPPTHGAQPPSNALRRLATKVDAPSPVEPTGTLPASSTPRTPDATFQLYTNPAHTNAAATLIELGHSLDISG